MEILSPNTDEPFLNYAKTQRVVLLIDLNPLISLQKTPDRFLSSLLCSAKSILSFPQLSSSLFAFRFFFSSLSPLFSSSKIQSLFPDSSTSLSFDRPIPALESLARALESLASRIFGGDGSSEDIYSSGSYFAAAMRQLVHDYAWDPLIDESTTGTPLNFDSVAVRSNLILLFSPVPSELNSLAKLFNVGIDDQCFANVCDFGEKFRGLFANVNDAFSSRDIQLSWIDVRSETEVEFASVFEYFMSGIKSLGWGFCTTDSIVLGSALIPFGLIYPKIGISPNSFSCDDCSEKLQAQLSLEIVDVSQKPLECKACNLELVDMKLYPRNGSCDSNVNAPDGANSRKMGILLKENLFTCFGDGMNKYKIKALHKNSEFRKLEYNLSDPILVREVSLKPGKESKRSSDGFFADKVLEMLTGSAPRKSSAPIWQILLTFLCKEGYCASTTISNLNGTSLTGILKPFTVSTALLFLTDADPASFSTKIGSEVSISSELCGKAGRKSITKKNANLLQDQTWDTFCSAAFESSEQDIEDIYFSKRCSDQKRLKFLKCWMKQSKKSGSESAVSERKSSPSQQEIHEDVKERLAELNHESEKPTSSASAVEYSLSEASRILEAEACRVQDSEGVDLQLESPDDFFSSLSHKIQQGLESEAVDLGALAQRLVNSSIYWLNRKQEMRNSESQMPEPKSQDSIGDSRGAELVRLLLKDPKDLTAKGKSSDATSQESSAEKIVRGYELQILFRMEILQSEFGGRIGEPMKQKFVKQICLLLETIQCHLEGGFFGDWSLDNYVGKIIKARYNLTLDGIVNKIYKKMDLLLFAEEEELPVNVFNNSEDSKPDGDEFDEFRSSERVSAEESLNSLETVDGTKEEHARKLHEAKARRERARRFTSFTSWVPDLQRVWAPKHQSKPTKPKSDPHGKRPRKKKRAEETVCETPMSKNRRSHRYHSDDEHFGDDKSLRSVSKALFQDDW